MQHYSVYFKVDWSFDMFKSLVAFVHDRIWQGNFMFIYVPAQKARKPSWDHLIIEYTDCHIIDQFYTFSMRQ